MEIRKVQKIILGLLVFTTTAAGVRLYTHADMLKINTSEYKISATTFSNESTFSDFSLAKVASKNSVYLSDIPYVADRSGVGWGSILLDKNIEAKYNNGLITLIIDGKQKSFLKGVTAHATSTLVYDITGMGFDYFETYYGVDASRGSAGNGVKFAIYTSVDGVNWDLHTKVSPPVKKGNTEAEFIKLDVKGKNFIKLYAFNNGNDASDHAVYANAKLYKEGYVESEDDKPYDFIKTLEEYDAILKNASYDELVTSKEHILLQRKLVSVFDYDLLQGYAHLDEDKKATVEWLMTDEEALKYFITGGKPIGSYMDSLKVLIRLYTAHKDDLNDTTRTQYTTLGDLYKRMMITLSLTHSTNVCLWVGGNQCSDAVTRYEIYKDMHSRDLLTNKVFETLNIEEMRWVMNNNIDDEEIEWLNNHVRRNNMNKDPYHYITYRFGYNYSLPQYYDQANYSQWDEKYQLSKYNITYQAGKPKLWIVFEQGSVCGGLSKTGSNINGAFGNPSAVIGQPGHAAYLQYSETEDGQGMWAIYNNVGGWTVAEKSERLLAGWGSNNWDSYYNVTYVPYAQEALNDLDNYNKALETMILADLYAGDLEKLEEIYRKALDYQSINMDAWYGLINVYNQNENKTAEDYINLVKELADAMYYFPLPMSDLLNLIKPHLDGTPYAATYTNYLRMSLEKGTQLNSTNCDLNQPAIAVTMANYLLGKGDYSIATFSFDGEDAKKIMLGSKYEGTGVRWDYSLDGGNTWIATSEKSVLLTDEEINRIDEENDIKIHIVGVNYAPENIYTIDIKKGALPTNLFANDLENRVVGINLTYEWKNSVDASWTSYAVSSPNNTGNKTLYIRIGATGTNLPSDEKMFTFTEDNQPDSRKYIPVSHLGIHAVSTEATSHQGSATNAIDGNYNSRWHSAWNGTDKERYITIKLDKPVYLSAVEFVPAGGGNGKIYDGTIYGSMDGENWEVLTQEKGLTYKNQANTIEDAILNTKSFEIEKPKQVQYVKIVADRTNGNWFTAREFNLFQDITNSEHPTAGVGYSTTEPTRENVVARLINPSADIEITEIVDADGKTIDNYGRDTYTFTDNGEVTFKFKDKETGKTGSAKAKVDWIDRVAPTATIEYSTTEATSKEVTAILKPSEEVTVINNGNYSLDENGQILDSEGNVLEGYTIDEEGYIISPEGYTVANIDRYKYEFTSNGEFTYEFVDKAGNRGSATAKVDWIDNDLPNATLNYDITQKTNKNVTVTIVFNKENVKILNNDGKNTYTFEKNGLFTFQYQDEAGNVGQITANVFWIDRDVPTAELKYERFDNKVIVTVINPSKEITFAEGNGTYEFTKNGSYDIVFYDKANNQGKVTAVITGLNDEVVDKPNDNAGQEDNSNTGNESQGNGDGPGNNTPNAGGNTNNSNTTKKPSTPVKRPNTSSESTVATDKVDNTDSKVEDENQSIVNDKNDESDKESETKKPAIVSQENNDDTVETEKVINVVFYISLLLFLILLITLVMYIKNRKED